MNLDLPALCRDERLACLGDPIRADALQVEATSRVELRTRRSTDVSGMSPMQKRRQRLRLRAVDAVIAAVKASGIRMRSLVRRRPVWLR